MKLKFLDRFRQWRLALPKLSELLDPRFVRLIILGSLVITFIIVGVIVFTQINRRMAAEAEAFQKAEAEKGITLQLEAPEFDDFIFPETLKMKSNAIFPVREPVKFWTDEEIKEYWVDLDTIDLTSFSEINHKLIESKLNKEP